jgi:hypothetical protein
MNAMRTAISRVITWNAARYEQIYNEALTQALLNEEAAEVDIAETEENYLKELMDVTFVGIGAMWKYGLNENQIFAALDPSIPTQFDATVVSLAEIANVMMDNAVRDLGLSQDQVVRALFAICDSNDAKTIKKTAPDVKANVVKGEFYRPAEPACKKILEERQNVTH